MTTTATEGQDLLDMETDNDNYSLVAAMDDHAIDDVPMDKAEIKRQRIAAAVQRSKTEYKPEHAYTERGVGSSCIGILR